MLPARCFGQSPAEAEREGASAQLKRMWQSEVTGPGMEEEAAAAGKDQLTSLRPAAASLSASFGRSDLNFSNSS